MAAVLAVIVVVRFVDINDPTTAADTRVSDSSPLTEVSPLAMPAVSTGFALPPAEGVAAVATAAGPGIMPGTAPAVATHHADQEPAKSPAAAPSLLTPASDDRTERQTNSSEPLSSVQPGVADNGRIPAHAVLAPEDALPVTEAPTKPTAKWLEHRISKGDTLAEIFHDHGLDARVLHGIVNSSKEAGALARIRPGQTLRLLVDNENSLARVELQRNRVETLRVSVNSDDFDFEVVNRDVERRVATATGLIESSLFLDGQKAGLSDGLIMELANIFGWDIDFALEIRAGDEFRVVFEEQYLDGEKLRDGNILAAEFTNRGETFRAIRYETADGEIGYYDDQGRSKRRAFIRTPIKFARISSRFNPKRWHPVLKKWRSHKGVDYAAPTGTPIRASGDGKVVFRGTKGGYGRTVILQHAGKYTTLYAHMSKYSKLAKTGTRVKQGQVIGYVGKTGLASGPHLHYEFRVNGVHKDPLRVKLPKSLALPKSEISRFKKSAAPLLARLQEIKSDTMLASAEPDGTRE